MCCATTSRRSHTAHCWTVFVYPGFVQNLKSPGILLFRIPGLESPGILKQSFWISVQVADKSGSSCWTCWPNLGSLEYNNTTSGIAFPLLYFNADTLITDFVYALFDLVQPMFWMERFLESPGKKHLNFCTNPVYHVYYHCYCCCKAFREHLPRLEVV